MQRLHCFGWIFPACLALLSAGAVIGQTYPNKPIRIVTGAAGGGADFISRQIAQGITGPLAQPVIVDNRPTSIIPGQLVSQAQPDGYTLLVSGGNLWIGPLLQETPYDVVKDFSPVTLLDRAPNILVVQPSLPVKSVKELIALAKAKPGELNYSSGPSGGAGHLSPELFKSMAGVNIVRVAYKGGAFPVNALLAGEVHMHFVTPPAGIPHIKAGKFRALAVTSAQPSVLVPGVPTISASGLPGYELVPVDAIFAPARTPAAVINRLNEEIARFLNTAEVKERFINIGQEAVSSSPAELAAIVKSDIAKMGKLIKDAGIRAD